MSKQNRIFMHYSVNGLEMTGLEDARDKAAVIVANTRKPLAILAHYAEDGAESIEIHEIARLK